MIEFSLTKKLNSPDGSMMLQVTGKIEKGKVIALYGPSGAGKTSVLRMIAGLMRPDEGFIAVDDQTWFDGNKKVNMLPQRRKVGFIWQDFALFPNMTVRENLKFALKKGEDAGIIDELIEIIALNQLSDKKPQSLSGGQKQRVALARALVQKPDILLLDEPLSALDLQMRTKLQDHLLRIHAQFKTIIIMVSHDLTEILKMAHQVMVLDQGKIIKFDSPGTVFGNKISDGSYRLEGTLLRIENDASNSIAHILIGDNIIRLPINKEKNLDFKPGDKIEIQDEQTNPVMVRK